MPIEDVLTGKCLWDVSCADCLAWLRQLPAGCAQTCVTSPPYWSLRDYQCEGQIGLEVSPDAYVDRLVEVFAEVKRVLRDDGTLWLNLGDSYSLSGKYGGHSGNKNEHSNNGRMPRTPRCSGLKEKDLVGTPWLVAFALRADGWYLRSEIIWAKPNPMPESVRDRPTRAHEQIFLFSKKARYYYDGDAVREPLAAGTHPSGNDFVRPERLSHGRAGVDGHNIRTVWTIPPEPLRDAHFATYPTKLVEPCVKAGTSEAGCCPDCGEPWTRDVKKERFPTRPGVDTKCLEKSDGDVNTAKSMGWNLPKIIGNRDPQRHCTVTQTIGWRAGCTCRVGSDRPHDTMPCLVIDPFAGSGTTILTALRLSRRALGVDLSPKYVELARRRIVNDCPMFNYQDTPCQT